MLLRQLDSHTLLFEAYTVHRMNSISIAQNIMLYRICCGERIKTNITLESLYFIMLFNEYFTRVNSIFQFYFINRVN